jgi:hypothetical protein
MKTTLALILCSALTALAQPTNVHFIKAKYGGWVTFSAVPYNEYQVQKCTNLTHQVWIPVNDYLATGTTNICPAKVWVSTTNQIAFFRVYETGWILPH